MERKAMRREPECIRGNEHREDDWREGEYAKNATHYHTIT